jgi:SAM-dependent methyltransferase
MSIGVEMPKKGEIDYLKNIGKEGQRHVGNKPFSDNDCGQYLIDIGSLISLLPPPPGKLLDIGAGTGWTSIFFAKRGYDVIAQDISEDMIALARMNKRRYKVKNLDFLVCDYEDMNLNEVFDYAIFYDSLHHSVDEHKAIYHTYKALKSGGICLACEPGVFHSRTVEARNAIEKWGVTERDMPPVMIIRAGRKAGFRKFKVYIRYQGPFEILSSFSVEGFRKACKHLARYLPGSGVMLPNIVLMIK